MGKPIQPKFDIKDIRYSTDQGSFERGVGLYNSEKVSNFETDLDFGVFKATVQGTHPYKVIVEITDPVAGDCDCYMGQQEIYCKHMIALGIHALKRGDKLSEEDIEFSDYLKANDVLGELNEDELINTKLEITDALKYIKPYVGPSKYWFQYQSSLEKGCRLLTDIVNELPVSPQTAKLLVNMLLRLDRKLDDGVDDSDGTVGGFIQSCAYVLADYAKKDKRCIKAFKPLHGRSTMFDWEYELLDFLDSDDE